MTYVREREIPFLRGHKGLLSQAVYCHTVYFALAWYALLEEMGYNQTEIMAYDNNAAFYRNVFIIKTSTFFKLVELMSKAIDIALNNARVRSFLEKDSGYTRGVSEVAVRVFQTPYYQLHPFIFERLQSFLLHAMKAKVCIPPDTRCSSNYG